MGLFGGSSKSSEQSHQEAGNKNLDLLNSNLGSSLGYVNSAGNGLSALLGLGGAGAQDDAFNNYANSAGLKFTMDQGSRAITDNAAARGLLNSGSTLKALTNYGQGLGQTYVNQYLQNLLGLGNLGLGAGNILSDAGKYSVGNSTKTSKTKPGLTQEIGGLASGVSAIGGLLSDRALKENVELVEELKPGLNLYSYTYIGEDKPIIGVMADEVANTYPECLGPVTKEGYRTVNYAALTEALYG